MAQLEDFSGCKRHTRSVAQTANESDASVVRSSPYPRRNCSVKTEVLETKKAPQRKNSASKKGRPKTTSEVSVVPKKLIQVLIENAAVMENAPESINNSHASLFQEPEAHKDDVYDIIYINPNQVGNILCTIATSSYENMVNKKMEYLAKLSDIIGHGIGHQIAEVNSKYYYYMKLRGFPVHVFGAKTCVGAKGFQSGSHTIHQSQLDQAMSTYLSSLLKLLPNTLEHHKSHLVQCFDQGCEASCLFDLELFFEGINRLLYHMFGRKLHSTWSVEDFENVPQFPCILRVLREIGNDHLTEKCNQNPSFTADLEFKLATCKAV